MKLFLRDLIERTVATYVETLIGLFLVAGVTDLSTLKVAAIAAIPAALAVVKAALAKYVGRPDSASLDPEVGPAEAVAVEPVPASDYEPQHRASDASTTVPPSGK